MPPGDKGPGNYIKEDRSVSNFSALDVGGAFEVILIQGNEEKLTVQADAEEMSDIVTEVVGDKLKVYTKSGWRGHFHDITIYLTFKHLDDINFSGAVEVDSQGKLSFEDLVIDISGASEVEMQFTAQKLEADFSGASEVIFTGNCQDCYVELSGASEYNAEALECTDLILELSGASDAYVFATGKLNIDASGASSVRYKGTSNLSVNSSGASTVRQF